MSHREKSPVSYHFLENFKRGKCSRPTQSQFTQLIVCSSRLPDNKEFANLGILKLSNYEKGQSGIKWYFLKKSRPTNPFTILKPHDQEISEFNVVEERPPTDLQVPKLRKRFVGRHSINKLSNGAHPRFKSEAFSMRTLFAQKTHKCCCHNSF